MQKPNTVSLYLGHPLTHADPEYRNQLFDLRHSIEQDPGIELMPFAWIEGKGPPPGVNVFEHDISRVERADLVAIVSDFPSDGKTVEILWRAMLGKPLLCFIHEELRVSQMIPDMLAHFRELCGPEIIPQPFSYRNMAEIRFVIAEWAEKIRNERASKPFQCRFANFPNRPPPGVLGRLVRELA